jgi:hypothetical protein
MSLELGPILPEYAAKKRWSLSAIDAPGTGIPVGPRNKPQSHRAAGLNDHGGGAAGRIFPSTRAAWSHAQMGEPAVCTVLRSIVTIAP